MANDLRIVDAPEIPSAEFTVDVKIPTGGKGNYSVTAGQISEFVKVDKNLTDKDYVDNGNNGVKQLLENHKNDQANPHVVTKAQIGLGNVNNTADLDKPVSNATSSAIITAIQYKADKTYVDTQLGLKTDKTYVDTQLGLKTDKTYVDYQDSLKVNKSDLGTASEYDVEDLPVTQKQRNDFVGHVNTIADLTEIRNAKAGQVMYVKSIDKNYTYTPSTTEAENGVTVAGKWVMEVPEAYYASWFAVPDLGDMSAKLATGYAYATSKKRTFVVDANFNVRSNQTIVGSPLSTAVNALSNSHLYFLPQGKLSLITANESNSNIICAKDVDNYIITSARLVGDRLTNTATEGSREWGYGLTIYPSSNGYIFEPDIKNCMGDGLYIGKSWAYETSHVPTNITVIRPKIDRVRRNGFSLTSGKNIFVDAPIISNVTTIDGVAPTEPASGLDVEPESAPNSPIAKLENCVVHNPTFINCDKSINFWNQAIGSFMDVRITGETNIYNSNPASTGLWMRNEIPCAVGSRLQIDKVVIHSKIDQPIFSFIYENSNVSVEIGELVNSSNQNLDFIYAHVGDNERFGNLTIKKLSSSNFNYGFTVAYSNLNRGCYTGLRIEIVDCPLEAYNLTPVTMMKKTSRYFVNNRAFVLGNAKTNELLSSVLMFESYNVISPTLDLTDDLSEIHISLSPTSPKANPLNIPNLSIPYEGAVYGRITLSSGASTKLKRNGEYFEVYELSYGGSIVDVVAN